MYIYMYMYMIVYVYVYVYIVYTFKYIHITYGYHIRTKMNKYVNMCYLVQREKSDHDSTDPDVKHGCFRFQAVGFHCATWQFCPPAAQDKSGLGLAVLSLKHRKKLL